MEPPSTFNLFGKDLLGEPLKQTAKGVLAEKFGFPPFSVLNAREGQWQERKRAWIATGIESELGRGEEASPGGSARRAADYSSGERGDGAGKAKTYNIGTWMESNDANGARGEVNGTSIFDPVLSELAYRWFAPPGGAILDPFAGGSVRGIVAGLMGYRYTGIDLSERQVNANREQKSRIAPDAGIEWIVGDSAIELPKLIDAGRFADLIFSCPPYGDLERYSDDPADLSRMIYSDFLRAYRAIIYEATTALRNNRFAVFVVGDFRNPDNGMYRGFVADTIRAFQDAGMPLYNDAVLVTAVGSLSIRAEKQFSASRKLGKTHQNVLTFVKGDPAKAAERISG